MIVGFSTEAKAFRLRNAGTGLCLDGYNGGGNINPYQTGCDVNNPYQQWDRLDLGNISIFDRFLLINRGTGLCLDGFASASQGNGARPYFFTCNTSNPYQVWSVIPFNLSLGSGARNILSEAPGSTHSLDGFNGGGNRFPYLYQTNFNNISQDWYFE